MKKAVLLYVAICHFNFTFAQYNVFKLDAFGLARSNQRILRASMERSFGKYFSGILYYEYGRFRYSYIETNTWSLLPKTTEVTKGWGIMPEIRFYPKFYSKQMWPTPLGFFVGLHYRYRSFVEEYNGVNNLNSLAQVSIKTPAKAYNVGVDIGCKLSASYLIIEGLIGFGMSGGTWQTPNERDKIKLATDLDDISNSARVEISVGLVFPKLKKNVLLPDNIPAEISRDSLKSDYATVIMYRPSKFLLFAFDYDVYMGDSLIAEVSNGSYHIFETKKTGRVSLWAKTEDKISLELNLEKGKTYFLRCGVTFGILMAQPTFEIVDADVGRAETEDIKWQTRGKKNDQ